MTGTVSVAKACALVIRRGGDGPELLVFEHPLAGMQLVKGTIEPSEEPAAAAARELREEAGVIAPMPGLVLGHDDGISVGQRWWFVVFEIEGLPEHWCFRTLDDGGHDFAFSWHRLGAAPIGDWHVSFRRALDYAQRLHEMGLDSGLGELS